MSTAGNGWRGGGIQDPSLNSHDTVETTERSLRYSWVAAIFEHWKKKSNRMKEYS